MQGINRLPLEFKITSQIIILITVMMILIHH